jgi:hypothetical protein
MARYECKCGNILSNTLSPNDVELHVYSDFEWDKIINSDTLNPISIPKPENEVWICNNCGRLYFFKGDQVSKVYKIEDDTI